MTDKRYPVIPQTSQCFGWCYENYHTSKIHVENKSELLQKENKDLLANSFASRYQEQSMLTKKRKNFWQALLLKMLQVETSSFRKTPTKQTTSWGAGEGGGRRSSKNSSKQKSSNLN